MLVCVMATGFALSVGSTLPCASPYFRAAVTLRHSAITTHAMLSKAKEASCIAVL
jgi:hypothetical protein